MDSTVFRVPGKKMDEFEKLFYSKEEWKNISNEVKKESNGWRGKIQSQLEMASIDMIKDDAFLKALQTKLIESGIKDSKFKGFIKKIDENTAILDLAIKCKSPSFLYRFLFDDNIEAVIKVECKQSEDETEIKLKFPIPKIFEFAGCLITIVLFAALIVPGLLWYMMMNSVKKVSKTVQEDVFAPTLKDHLIS